MLGSVNTFGTTPYAKRNSVKDRNLIGRLGAHFKSFMQYLDRLAGFSSSQNTNSNYSSGGAVAAIAAGLVV